jgi:hypothetical protein
MDKTGPHRVSQANSSVASSTLSVNSSMRALAGHDVEPAPHHRLAEPQQQRKDQRGLEQREQDAEHPAGFPLGEPVIGRPQGARGLGRRAARRPRHVQARRPGHRGDGGAAAGQRQRRNHDQQRDHREVLEQQDAEGPLTMLALELPPLGEQLADQCRRRHRGGPADRQCAPPVERAAQEHRLPARGQQGEGRDDRRDRRGHLGAAQTEHEAAHGAELGEIEFQPQREHQEHDPDLAQTVRPPGDPRPARPMRPQQNAHRQGRPPGRQAGHAQHHHRRHDGDEQDQRDLEGGEHGELRYTGMRGRS